MLGLSRKTYYALVALARLMEHAEGCPGDDAISARNIAQTEWIAVAATDERNEVPAPRRHYHLHARGARRIQSYTKTRSTYRRPDRRSHRRASASNQMLPE